MKLAELNLPFIDSQLRVFRRLWLLFFPGLALFVMMQANASPESQACVDMASQHYNIRRDILSAVLAVEGGSPGMKKRNKNGSYDMGPMQINSTWLPELQRHGISEYDVTNDYCTNVLIGAWILKGELRRGGAPQMNTAEFWQAVGRYNSHTPYFNARYAVLVWHKAKSMQLAR